MDTTFITIHDLSDDAHILYSSDSIVDILGHTPDEVVNRSVWQFFHPDEIPLAKAHRPLVQVTHDAGTSAINIS
jgi:PAS domain S-box-containing protein